LFLTAYSEADRLFDKGDYGAAAEKVSEVIALDSTVADYFERRKECHLRLNMLREAEKDRREALRLKEGP
jgi:hypothetical protein